jgi:uncharacterized membrane protein YdjX (TVP38/TMEM64 family)
MQKEAKESNLKNIFISLVIFCIIIFAVNIVISQLDTKSIKDVILSFGPIGPLSIILYTVISHVVAPLSATPIFLISIAIYGVWQTSLYEYIGSLISAALCFWIARIYGRTLVYKLVGKKTIHEIDRFVEISGTQLLVVSRLIGFSIFEVISYAFGLTEISFKKYMLITALCDLLPNLIFIYLTKDVDFTKPQNIIIAFLALSTIALIFSYYIKKNYDKYKKLAQQEKK